jgi:hypothetical protein
LTGEINKEGGVLDLLGIIGLEVTAGVKARLVPVFTGTVGDVTVVTDTSCIVITEGVDTGGITVGVDIEGDIGGDDIAGVIEGVGIVGVTGGVDIAGGTKEQVSDIE